MNKNKGELLLLLLLLDCETSIDLMIKLKWFCLYFGIDCLKLIVKQIQVIACCPF